MLQENVPEIECLYPEEPNNRDLSIAFKKVFDNELNAKRQKVLIFFMMGFSIAEITDITGEKYQTIRSRLNSALTIIKDGLARI